MKKENEMIVIDVTQEQKAGNESKTKLRGLGPEELAKKWNVEC